MAWKRKVQKGPLTISTGCSGLKTRDISGTKEGSRDGSLLQFASVSELDHAVQELVSSWANALCLHPLRLEFLPECRPQAGGDTQHP